MKSRANSLLIRTPEGITFALPLAGPMTRFLAKLIDFLCVLLAMNIIGVALAAMAVISPDFAMAFQALLYFALEIGYGITAEWLWRGQTLGKRLLRLRVADADGLRLEFNQVVIRNLLRFVDALPAFYLVGGVACLLNSRAQRLGDLAANTIVLREPKIAAPDLDQLFAGRFNSLREHPHLAARLRQRVSPGEATVALQALVRRDHFDPVARVELFAELAAHFRSLVAFPAESTEGVPDEQYVRNVVDVVFRPNARAAARPSQAEGRVSDAELESVP